MRSQKAQSLPGHGVGRRGKWVLSPQIRGSGWHHYVPYPTYPWTSKQTSCWSKAGCVWRQDPQIFITCCLSLLLMDTPKPSHLDPGCKHGPSAGGVCHARDGTTPSSNPQPVCGSAGLILLISLMMAFPAVSSSSRFCFWSLWFWWPIGFPSWNHQGLASLFGSQLYSVNPLPSATFGVLSNLG